MHVYLYDSFLSDKKYESTLAKIETRLTDLGLNGRIIRLSSISSIQNTIYGELNKGAKTFIAVGNIKILNQVVNSMANSFSRNSIGKDTPLGFIPIGKNFNDIVLNLGIDFEENACDFLAARRTEVVDLGLVNQSYFLSQAQISTIGTSLEIDTNYSIEIRNSGEIYIINLPNKSLAYNAQSLVNDDALELVIKSHKKFNFPSFNSKDIDSSVFSFKKLIISNPVKKIILDDTIEISTPASISIAKEKINLIVGKNRAF